MPRNHWFSRKHTLGDTRLVVLLPGLEYSYFVKENRFMEILRESVVQFLKENISATGILF